MENHTTSGDVQKLALLIGINYYKEGTARNVVLSPLRGCVRDVEEIDKYLRKNLKVPKENIMKLTSTLDPKTEKAAEPEDQLPTRDNIMRRLRDLHTMAGQNAIIYIHYSGHGMLRQRIASENNEGGDRFSGATLVPMDVRDGGAYLTAFQLGEQIKEIVDDPNEKRNRRVILVLDCCHSGGGIREPESGSEEDSDESEDNEKEEDAATPQKSKFSEADEVEVRQAYENEEDQEMLQVDWDAEAEADPLGERGAETGRQSWLENPSSCSILTACGVDETAKEARFTGGRSGVLTHWMLDILKQYPPERPPSYTRIRNHVISMVEDSKPRRYQTPGALGDIFHEFFSQRSVPFPDSSAVFKSNIKGKYILRSGRAQGVAKGAIYELEPEGRLLEKGSGERGTVLNDAVRPRQLRIETVGDLRSVAMPVLQGDLAAIDSMVKSGYRAVLQSWALPREMVVKVIGEPPPDAPPPAQVSDTTPLAEVVNTSPFAKIRDSLQDKLQSTPGFMVKLGNVQGPEDFGVVIGPEQVVKILDGRGMWLPRVPRICLHHGGAITRLADTLQHLARYQSVSQLAYGGPRGVHTLPSDRFSFAPYDDESKRILNQNASGEYQAREDQKVVLRFSFVEGAGSVYVAMFDLDESWGIIKRWPKPGGAAYQLRRGDPPLDVSLTMKINPADPSASPSASSSIRDKMRAYVYAGSRVPDWEGLQLAHLSTQPTQPARDPSDDDGRYGDDDDIWGENEDGQWTVMDVTIVTTPVADT